MSRVMIAEEQSAMRKRIEKLLEAKDLDVESVSNKRELLEKVVSHKPDLVLLDVMMPGLTGLDVIDRLRSSLGDVPLLIMTANTGKAAAALARGALDFISKPLDEDELLVRVEHALEARPARAPAPLEVPLRELHDPDTGRIDAKKVAEFLGVSLTKVAEAIEANYQTVYKTPASPALQKRLRPIEKSIELISRATRNAMDARAWLNTPHPSLGELTPMDVIMSGRAGAVVTMLENAFAGIPS